MKSSRSLRAISFAVMIGLVVAPASCGDDGGSRPPSTAPDAAAESSAACAPPAFTIGSECITPGAGACRDGFAPEPAGAGCVEVVAETCPAGKMPDLGSETCVPVGMATCDAGFLRDDSGFGCKPSSVETCTGASRETSSGCVAIGDCAAAFPPAAATIFVDDSFGAGQLDATHFKTIAAAIQAAPAGATIAVESGTYAEALTVTKSLSIVGRCAAEVTLTGTSASAGVAVAAAVGGEVAVQGVRITDFGRGVDVSGGGSLVLAEAVVSGSRGHGVRVSGAGSKLSIRRSTVRDTVLGEGGPGGLGASVDAGASLVIEDSAVVGSREVGVSASGAGTNAKVTKSVIARAAAPDGLMAPGARATAGARIDIDASVIEKSAGVALDVNQASAAVVASVLVDIADGKTPSGTTPIAAGLRADRGAEVTVERSTIAGAQRQSVQLATSKVALRDVALVPADGGGGVNTTGAEVELTRVAVVGASGFGIGARDASTAKLDRVLITKTRPKTGVSYALVAAVRSEMDGRDVVVTDTVGTGVLAFDRGRLALERSVVDRTKLAGGTLGVGVLSEDRSTVTLRSSVVRRATSLGVVAKGAKVDLDGVVIREMQEINDGISGMALLAVEAGGVTLKGVSMFDVAVAAIIAGDPETTVTGSDVTASRVRQGNSPGARGVQVQGGARIELTRAHLFDTRGVSAMAYDASLVLRDSRVERTAEGDPPIGHGIVASGGRLDVFRVAVSGNASAGLVYVDATGLVVGSRIEQNAIGLNVSGASELVAAAVDPADPPEKKVLVSSDTEFVGNATRVGSGPLPIPPPIELP